MISSPLPKKFSAFTQVTSNQTDTESLTSPLNEFPKSSVGTASASNIESLEKAHAEPTDINNDAKSTDGQAEERRDDTNLHKKLVLVVAVVLTIILVFLLLKERWRKM